MTSELLLNFSDVNQFSIGLTGGLMSGLMPFSVPLTDENFQDIRWYLEIYGTQYMADVDDDRAGRIQEQLETWGAALYGAITKEPKAFRVMDGFLNNAQAGRVLTINSDQPSILGLPWELMFIPGSDYLFNEEPSISVRRNLMDGREGREQAVVEPKGRLHLLFVVSRPVDEGFLDPRLDPQAVMDAIDQHGQDRISVEFLRPATTESLRKRLANR